MKNDDKKQNNTIDDKKNKANKAKTLTINQEKIALLKRKFTFIRKIRPLKLQKNDSKEKIKFDKKTAENIYEVDLVSIWEKPRNKRSLAERYYYRKENQLYRRYFFIYLAREIARIRWIERKTLGIKFFNTIIFITFFALLFKILELLIFEIIKLLKPV